MGRRDKTVTGTGVGADLRRKRQAMKISLTEMASYSAMSKGYLSMVETGREPVSENVLRAYTERLGFPFFENRGIPESEKQENVSEDTLKNGVFALKALQYRLHELKHIAYEEYPRSQRHRDEAQRLRVELRPFGLALLWSEEQKEYIIVDGVE